MRATLILLVAASASAAVVTGSRRKRWQAIHNVVEPPASAARACAAMVDSGARPSMAMPSSAMEAVRRLERHHQLLQPTPHQRRFGQGILDRTRILEARRGQQRNAALVGLDRALRPQALDRSE